VQLRPYQAQHKTGIYSAWAVVPNVLAVLPTGGGKTVLFSDILKGYTYARVAIAHRQELVGQISLALARDGVHHSIIGPKNVIRFIVSTHVAEVGASFYDAGSPCAVAGVDTLLRRKDDLATWCNQVRLWVQDEAHHVLKDNKWGKAAALFPNAKGLGVTANTIRADGKGLGRHADGLMDVIVEGPGMRDLINQGFLTDYRIYSPPSDLDMSGVSVGKDGEYNQKETRLRIKKSHIIGDVVKHYLRLANGKLGITFARDVETATEIAAEYNAAGVPAEVVSAKTPDKTRAEILRRFRNRNLLQLVNVDLFGGGLRRTGYRSRKYGAPYRVV
jgi:superfamily II DNA or RNA helicase